MKPRMLGIAPLALASLVGCGGVAPATGPVALDGPVTVTVAGRAPDSSMELDASGGQAVKPQPIALKIEEIALSARSGAHPRIEGLTLPLADVDVPASVLPPTGLALRELTLRLPQAVAAKVIHQQPDALELEAETPLELDWSLVLDDGSLYPLGPARTEPLRLEVDVVRQGEQAVVTVTARCEGTCWSLDGVARLQNGSLFVEAPAEVEAAR